MFQVVLLVLLLLGGADARRLRGEFAEDAHTIEYKGRFSSFGLFLYKGQMFEIRGCKFVMNTFGGDLGLPSVPWDKDAKLVVSSERTDRIRNTIDKLCALTKSGDTISIASTVRFGDTIIVLYVGTDAKIEIQTDEWSLAGGTGGKGSFKKDTCNKFKICPFHLPADPDETFIS
jgi:hypothetical protein